MKMNWRRDRILMISAALLAFGLTGCLDDAGISTGDIVDLLTADDDGNDPSDVDGDGIPDGDDGNDPSDVDLLDPSDVDLLDPSDVDMDGDGIPDIPDGDSDNDSGDLPADQCIALEEEMFRCYEENPEYPEACFGFEEMVNDCRSGDVLQDTDFCEQLDMDLQMCWEDAAATGEDIEMCFEIENLLMDCLDGVTGEDPSAGCVFLEEDLAFCYEENPDSPDVCLPFEEMLNDCLDVDPSTGTAADPCGDGIEEINLCWDEFAATGLDPERCIMLEESLADCAG